MLPVDYVPPDPLEYPTSVSSLISTVESEKHKSSLHSRDSVSSHSTADRSGNNLLKHS